VKSDQFYSFHLILAELTARGESIQQERQHVLKLLDSSVYPERVCGWQTVRAFYPEVASQIAQYHPKDSVEVCRRITQHLTGSV
jgi:hypothetical protein